MKKIITEFIKYPFYSKLVVTFLIIGGLVGLFSMKKSFFPESSERYINISVTYPGASPKEMEEGITLKVEEAIKGIVGIKEVTSTSSENYAYVTIEVTGDYDIDETLLEVKNAVDSIASFPVDAEKPVVSKQRSTTWAMNLGLSGDVDLLTLKKYADQIEDDLLASGVVTQVNVSGYPDLEISVEVSEADLLRYNLTFQQIASAIASNNLDISAGEIKSSKEEILIRTRARSVNPNDIGNIILKGKEDGGFLRIRDVAVVQLKFEDVAYNTKMNGKTAVYFQIYKLPEEDLDEISDYMHNFVDEFNTNNQGVNLSITWDFLKSLNSRLELLYQNGGFGLILVVIALGLFLSFRLSLWVAWGIPASFLATFIVAPNAGITINMQSLFGMILVIGILVDDGIVIAENIYTHFENGKSPKKAAIDGAMEVLPAVFTSVTTTIVAFSPLFLLKGTMEFMYDMAFIVVFSLFFSLVEAFFVLPAHIGNEHILRVRKRVDSIKKATNKVSYIFNVIRSKLTEAIDYLRFKLYAKAIRKVIEWRWFVVTIPVALLLLTIGLIGGRFIETTFFPTIEFDSIEVNFAFGPGTGEERTMKYLDRFTAAIWELNDELKKKFNDPDDFITYSFSTVGSAFDGDESGSHAGQIFTLLRDMEGAPITTTEISKMLSKKIGTVNELEKMTIGGEDRWGSPVSISLLGSDMDELNRAKEFLSEKLHEYPELININDNNTMGKREVRLELKPKAYFLGLNISDVSNQVRYGFYGGQAQRLQSGKDELRVYVRYPKDNRENIGQLESMKIKTGSNEYPLMEIADYKIERGPVSINHFNSLKEIRVDADMLDRYAPVPPILQSITKNIIPELKSKFPSVKIEYQGQQKHSNEASQEIVQFFSIAFSLIVVILLIHFKSTFHTFIILLMIPLAWIGAAWGHGIEGLPISMLSAWGMVALSGVIINDSVVFLSKYNQNLKEGMKVINAAVDAGIMRLRAILLTSLTTVVGLYPIILENSFQAQFLKPMAVSLAYGVLCGTFFLLMFFPALIVALNDFKVWTKSKIAGKQLTREEVEPAVIYSKISID